MRGDLYLTSAENKLADIIWREGPVCSPGLVQTAQTELGWKKSTTYTILKKLCDKEVARNDSAVVSAVMTREEYAARQSRRYVEDAFGGSLPRFIAAFVGGRRLSPKQADELKRLIDEYREDGV